MGVSNQHDLPLTIFKKRLYRGFSFAEGLSPMVGMGPGLDFQIRGSE